MRSSLPSRATGAHSPASLVRNSSMAWRSAAESSASRSISTGMASASLASARASAARSRTFAAGSFSSLRTSGTCSGGTAWHKATPAAARRTARRSLRPRNNAGSGFPAGAATSARALVTALDDFGIVGVGKKSQQRGGSAFRLTLSEHLSGSGQQLLTGWPFQPWKTACGADSGLRMIEIVDGLPQHLQGQRTQAKQFRRGPHALGLAAGHELIQKALERLMRDVGAGARGRRRPAPVPRWKDRRLARSARCLPPPPRRTRRQGDKATK